VRVTLWGTRGSVARAGMATVRYGGDTSVVEVEGSDGTRLILDGGSGMMRVTPGLGNFCERIDVLLTHLHMDHIQGLGFFYPLRDPNIQTHVWGPVSTTMTLDQRLARYLSPPLFPVRLRDLQSFHTHDVGPGTFEIGPFTITADLIIHPGPTLGYRIEENGTAMAYMPDHEPALGYQEFPAEPEWTSGFDLMKGVDLLIHDAQYTEEEYEQRVGWGHSTLEQAVGLATQAGVKTLVTFHHDPEHTDQMLDEQLHEALQQDLEIELVPGRAGSAFEL
jgi:phosphoribosyl 1,2-cyclic phosphodiesterase